MSTNALTTSSFDRYLQEALLCRRMIMLLGDVLCPVALGAAKICFWVLCRVRPIAISGKTVVLTKQQDIREVLGVSRTSR